MKFLVSVFKEMKQVTWLPFGRLMSMTWTVVASLVVFALFFSVIGYGVTSLIQALLAL